MFNITVVDDNDIISDIIITNKTTLRENSTEGIQAAVVTVIDDDSDQPVSCLVVNGSHIFALNPANLTDDRTAALEVLPGATLDFESEPSIVVTIQCTDNVSLAETSFLINLEDVNEPPEDILLSGSHEVPENSPTGFVVGYLTCIDPDRGQFFTYVLFGPNAHLFKINPMNAQLQAVNSRAFDYELRRSDYVNLTVEAADNGAPPLLLNKTFSIRIVDVNEGPRNVTLSSDSLTSNDPLGMRVGRLGCTNPEEWQVVTYQVTSVTDAHGRADTIFAADNTVNGSFLVLAKRPMTDWTAYYTVGINATDNGSPPMSVSSFVTVHVFIIDPCSPPCGQNAYCDRPSLQCMCMDGFTGPDCSTETDLCSAMITPDPGAGISISPGIPKPVCRNNGTCRGSASNYTCDCKDGFAGQDCQYDMRCFNSRAPKCQNKGVCVSYALRVFCRCPRGFVGPVCETNEEDCTETSCLHGTCIDGVASFSCTCSPGFTGSRCSYKINACENTSCTAIEQCVPKLQRAVDITTTSMPGRAASQKQESNIHICVPHVYLDHEPVINLTANDKDLFKDLLERVSVPSPGGSGSQLPDDVYIFKTPSTDQVSYVVTVDGEPVDPAFLCPAIKKRCDEVTREAITDLARLCRRLPEVQNCPLEPTQWQPPDSLPGGSGGKSSNTLPVLATSVLVSAFLVFLLVAILAYTARKRIMMNHKRMEERQPILTEQEEDTLAQTYNMYEDYSGIMFHRHANNPLFRAEGFDEDDSVLMVENPTYDAAFSRTSRPRNPLPNMGANDQTRADNPIYEGIVNRTNAREDQVPLLDGSPTDDWEVNPSYERLEAESEESSSARTSRTTGTPYFDSLFGSTAGEPASPPQRPTLSSQAESALYSSLIDNLSWPRESDVDVYEEIQDNGA